MIEKDVPLPKIKDVQHIIHSNSVISNSNSARAVITGVLGGILGYLQPIANDIFALIYIFVLNFLFGYLQGRIVKGEDFDLKKAWRCILESCVFFFLICTIFVIGRLKNQMEGSLQCASTVSWAVIYFYTTNILKNLKQLLKKGTPAWMVVSFLYWVLSFEMIKKIPMLNDYMEVYQHKEAELQK